MHLNILFTSFFCSLSRSVLFLFSFSPLLFWGFWFSVFLLFCIWVFFFWLRDRKKIMPINFGIIRYLFSYSFFVGFIFLFFGLPNRASWLFTLTCCIWVTDDVRFDSIICFDGFILFLSMVWSGWTNFILEIILLILRGFEVNSWILTKRGAVKNFGNLVVVNCDDYTNIMGRFGCEFCSRECRCWFFLC